MSAVLLCKMYMPTIWVIKMMWFIYLVNEKSQYNENMICRWNIILDLNLAKLKGSTKFGKFPVGPPACRSASADKGIIEEKDDMIALGFSLCVLYGKELSLPWMTKAFKNPKSNFVRTMLEIKEKTVVKDWVSTNLLFSAVKRINFGFA